MLLAGFFVAAPAFAAAPYHVTIEVVGNSGGGCMQFHGASKYTNPYVGLAGDCAAYTTPSLGASAADYCANLADDINDPSIVTGNHWSDFGFVDAPTASCAGTTLTIDYTGVTPAWDGTLQDVTVAVSSPDFADGTSQFIYPTSAGDTCTEDGWSCQAPAATSTPETAATNTPEARTAYAAEQSMTVNTWAVFIGSYVVGLFGAIKIFWSFL